MKAYKKYLLVRRQHEQTTGTGIILSSNNSDKRGIKVTVVSGQTDSVSENDEIYVDRSKLIELEHDDLFAIEPDYILSVV